MSPISNSSNFSNFITVGHRIFFAIGNTVIVMDIFDTAQTQQYPELPECTQIHKLVPTIGAGNQQMLVAYCSDRYIYLDPVYGDWTNIQLFSSSGVPYLCPDNNYRATLFINGTLQFTVKDLLLNTINGISIIKSSGVCFESQNKTYFAYSDQQHNNIFVYDFTTQNHYPILSPYDCSHQDCPQLLLLDNQYLVVRDDNCDIVLDVTTNFSLLINISGGIADILTILRINVICHTITSGPAPPITQNNTTITTVSPSRTIMPSTNIPYKFTTLTDIPEPTTSVVVHSNSRLVGITLTVLGLFIIILLLAMVAVGFFIRYLRRRW